VVAAWAGAPASRSEAMAGSRTGSARIRLA
jgi:hypothetical protein